MCKNFIILKSISFTTYLKIRIKIYFLFFSVWYQIRLNYSAFIFPYFTLLGYCSQTSMLPSTIIGCQWRGLSEITLYGFNFPSRKCCRLRVGEEEAFFAHFKQQESLQVCVSMPQEEIPYFSVGLKWGESLPNSQELRLSQLQMMSSHRWWAQKRPSEKC